MNKRERMLAMIVGGAIGLTVLYQVVNFIFIRPIITVDAELEELERDVNRLDGIIRSRKNLAQRWLDLAAHTLSFNRAEATNRFGQDLKNLAEKHGFPNALFTPTSGTRIGAKTEIATLGYRVSAEGRYAQVLGFIKATYETPYICAISKLSMSPIQLRGRLPDEVKVEFTIETPILPKIDKTQFEEVVNAETISEEALAKGEPFRDWLRTNDAYALLDRRNIFKPYIPPPQNVVMLVNDDWKTVAARVRFYWEGDVQETKVETIPSKAQQSVSGFGEFVEIEGSYADGKPFGPQKLDFSAKKDWTYTIAAHHPPPPPDFVLFAVDNKDKNPVDFEIVLTLKDGQTKSYPTMRAQPGKVTDVDQFEVKSLTATATYSSGKKALSATFSPKKEKQTYVVPPEPAEAVVQSNQPVSDPPADPQYTVSGLVTYRGVHEMVATGTANKRVVLVAGEPAAVDGGTLLGVHPLGGVVKMPSGNFYLYPLGKKFTDRVKLEAKIEEELPGAIDAWAFSNQEPPSANGAVNRQ